jgi:Pyridoxal-phosphate dependent enzyme
MKITLRSVPFKVRGGLVYFDRLKRERPEVSGIITATRGNHGQSLAYAGARAGIAVTIGQLRLLLPMAWQCASPIRQRWSLFARKYATTKSLKRSETSTVLTTTAPRAPVPRRGRRCTKSAANCKGSRCGHPHRENDRGMDAKRAGGNDPDRSWFLFVRT